MNKTRIGFVAIVTVGICTLILGLILTLTLKVRGALTDNRGLEKRIQSFLLYQAAIVYLNPYWDKRSYNTTDWGQLAGGSRLYLRPLSNSTFRVGAGRTALNAQKSAGWFWINGNSSGDYQIMTVGGPSDGSTSHKSAPFDARLYFWGKQHSSLLYWDFTPSFPGDTTNVWPTTFPVFAEAP